MKRRLLAGAVVAIGLGACVIGWHGVIKPLPAGLSVQTPARIAFEAKWIADLTYVDSAGTRFVDQSIFDEVFEIIRLARVGIVLDLFLFNEYQGALREETRALCSELTKTLIAKKRAVPEIEIFLITDPINTVYGGLPSTHLEELRASGIHVIVTDLDPLRDSNWLYSSIWRWFIRPFGGGNGGFFPNPFGGERVSLRTGLRVLNFKANHRKTIVADSPRGWTGLVTSANPHDASSAHGNLAIRFDGPAVADLLETERVVARFSGGPVPSPIELESQGSIENRNADGVRIRILTEGAIGKALDETLASAQSGDEIDVAVFYLSDRRVIEAMIESHRRGVSLRVLLDPNKDAFGRNKNGIPNRPVARELHQAGIPVRWCDTHGEQCHAKMLLMRQGESGTLIAGSANFTRRNLRDLNLETNVWIKGRLAEPALRDAGSYFERVWRNEPGRLYSVDYEAYAEESRLKDWLYRVGEFAGIGTY